VRAWRAGLLRAASLVLLATQPGCPRAEPKDAAAEPASSTGSPSGTAQTAHYVLRVLGMQDCTVPAAAAPADGTRRLGVELVLEPTSELQVPANPYYARLLDEHQLVYEATLGGCGTPLSPTLPRRGQVARGYVVFDVPRSSRNFTLLYMPELVGAAKEEASIALRP
jgi:hypothetical protein